MVPVGANIKTRGFIVPMNKMLEFIPLHGGGKRETTWPNSV
jgi:hypothetical protein